MRRTTTIVLLLAGAAAPATLDAQRSWQWEAALSGIGMRVNSTSGPATQKLSGAVFGFQGHVLFARLITFNVGYWQGQITPADGQSTIAPRDVVEGYAQIGARPLPWLWLRGGPHAWTYISNAGRQRWLLMEGRARVQGEIIPDLQSYLELWNVFSANVNVPQGFQSGRGGEGGISLRIRDVPIIPERFPVRIRAAYGIERVRMEGGVRAEVVDRLSLSIGIENH
jgi:hypothetical protein